MATASKKTKTARRPPSKAKSKKRNAPLLAARAAVRKARPLNKLPAAKSMSSVLSPALPMLNSMARVTAAYVELPYRLAQCRSPMDLWREQARFAQSLFCGFLMTPPTSPSKITPREK